MPNHVTNKITFTGEGDYEELKEFMATEKSEFDFNKIIPMPESLDIDATFTELRNAVTDPKTDIEKRLADNIKKYGHPYWYNWAIANWGTKWGEYDVTWDENTVTFLTAWSGVPSLMRKLSEMFPTLVFDYKYADEDYGSNTGAFIIQDGEFIYGECFKSNSTDALKIAALLLGERDDYYEQIDT